MINYISMANAIRSILERAKPSVMGYGTAPDGGPEKDMNDQIAVGSYQTKAFEMSDKAQKLYSNLPKNTPSSDAEASAINLDKLFDLFKKAVSAGHVAPSDMEMARTHVDKIEKLAKNMSLEKEHKDITDGVMRQLADYSNDYPSRVINPDEHKHPSDDSRFNTSAKEYNTDRTSDRDVDNVKNYLIRRSLKAQRKLKIIDND